MLKLRLQRVGRKNDPSFRVVVTESTNGPKSGNFIEILGSYDARQGKPILKADRIKHWISKGVVVSDTMNNMLVKFKIIEGETRNVLPKRKPAPAKEEPQAEVKAEVETKTETTEEVEAPAVESPVEEKQDTEDASEEKTPEESVKA